uniref:SET domain-containing protein n=1 Tax=Panagrolaimus superbus TaxID=310955 RepID=A0A914YIJ2_9BILA
MKESPSHGIGVFAVVDFKRRTKLCQYFGEKISEEEADFRQSKDSSDVIYMFRLNNGDIIDAKNSFCIARRINHRCRDANCFVKENDNRELEVITKRKILAGEELNIDYMMNSEEGKPPIPCFCKSGYCTGSIDYCAKFN